MTLQLKSLYQLQVTGTVMGDAWTTPVLTHCQAQVVESAVSECSPVRTSASLGQDVPGVLGLKKHTPHDASGRQCPAV